MSRYRNKGGANQVPGKVSRSLFGSLRGPVELHHQMMRLVAAIVLAGLGVGTLAGVTAAARNQPTILIQTPSDPHELAPARVALPELRLAAFEPAPERLDEFVQETIDTEQTTAKDLIPAKQGAPVILPGPARARIALIIDDLGLHSARARAIAELPVPMTLSWLPYAEQLRTQTGYAFERGHQIFAHVPMQPGGDEDPGPNALMTWHGKKEIKSLLDLQLSEFTELSGINNHMGSRFTSNAMSMTWFMAEVKARDLLFVDSLTSSKSQGATVAKAYGLPFLRRDFFIDHDAKGNAALIEKRLAALEALALERGEVVAIGHPYAVTIAGLETWIPAAQARGIEFITVSRLTAARSGSGAVRIARQES